jgi:ElaB/YqjD/DUF883 family membrane-anchored ribosome-binding protein
MRIIVSAVESPGNQVENGHCKLDVRHAKPFPPHNEHDMTPTTTLTGNTGIAGTNPVAAAADRAQQAVDRVAEKAAPAIDRASTAAHRTIDKAADVAAPAADWVSENGKQLKHRSTELADACGNYVRERPLTSIVGALAIGYFAGKLMR